MRNCYNDIINSVEGSIACNSYQRAEQLADDFCEEKMYNKFVSCIIDEQDEKQMEQEIDSLLNDLI